MAQFLEGSVKTPTLEDLRGTRCRLQRLRDLKFLSGWVRSVGAQQITVELKDSLAAEQGETFNLEAATGEFNVAYPCMLIKAEQSIYRLSITGEPLITTPGQEARYRAHQVEVDLQILGSVIEARAVDISASGIGLLISEPLARFARVRLAARNGSTSVECQGMVRYCRPDQEQRDSYRVGIEVDFADRLSKAMWMRMVQTTSNIDKAAA